MSCSLSKPPLLIHLHVDVGEGLPGRLRVVDDELTPHWRLSGPHNIGPVGDKSPVTPRPPDKDRYFPDMSGL